MQRINRPYTTRGDKTDFDLSVADNGKGWKRAHAAIGDSLKSLAKDLPDVPENTVFTRSDVSVPSPWASLLSFDIILKNREDDFGALKTRAINEWRGLLTIFALKDLFGLRFGKEEIDLTRYNGNEADKAFFSNILELKPEKSLFKNDSCWNKFVFLSLEDNIIGVFSNSTLVSSNYSYEENLATKKLQEIGIMDGNLNFINPVHMFKNDLTISLFMTAWLETLKRNIPEIPEGDAIGTVIDEFVDDIKANYIGDIVTYNELANNNFIEFEFDFSQEEPSNAFELLWNIKIKKMDLSMPQIQNKIKLGKVQNSTFVLEGLGKNVVKLMEILGDKCIKPLGTYIDNKSAFLDKMTLVKVSEDANSKIVKAYEDNFGICSIEEKDVDGELIVNKYSYILPVGTNVLNSLPSYIIRQISEITETDEDIIVKLTMELEDGTPCDLKRIYKKSECNKIYNCDLSTIAIWPYASIFNEKNENVWKDYYVFSARNKNDKAYTTKVKYDGQENELTYNEMSRIDRDSRYERKVAQSEKLPTYLSIYKNDYDYQGNLLKEEHIGIIVLKEPEIVANINPDIRYLVGFDFGTTSTTAFCKRLEDISSNHKFVKFGQLIERSNDRDAKQKITLCDMENGTFIGDNNDGCYIVYNNESVSEEHEPEISFVPHQYPNRKAYMSLYKQNSEDTVRTIEEKKSLKYGNIIFDQGLVSYISEEDLIRNLKWGTDRKTQVALSGFLSQIMKEIAFTLAKNNTGSIIWRFSYPTSLSNRELKQYQRVTKELVEYISELSGLESKLDNSPYYPESIASAKFSDEYSNDYICFDIGGGSTDVSLWKKNLAGGPMSNIMQFSIGIASRKIFLTGITDAIVNTKQVFESRTDDSYIENNIQKQIRLLLRDNFQEDMSYKLQSVIDKIKETKKLNDRYVTEAMQNFSYIIEPLLQTNGRELSRIMETESEIFDQFRQFLIVGFWGILYYTAISLSKFKDELQDTRMIDINLAGNGSMLYDWIQDYYEEGLKKAFEQALNKYLGKDDSNKISVVFSFTKEDLKTEAARGLLKIDERINIDKLLEHNSIINGANCVIKYKSGEKEDVSFNESILENKTMLNYFEDPEETDVDEILIPSAIGDLTECIDIMNNVIFASEKKMRFDLESVDANILESNIRVALRKNIESGTIAPTFILEIEALLRTILGY